MKTGFLSRPFAISPALYIFCAGSLFAQPADGNACGAVKPKVTETAGPCKGTRDGKLAIGTTASDTNFMWPAAPALSRV